MSLTDTTKRNKLDDLPAEVLCRVADYLPKARVQALRLTNRAIQIKTFNTFTDDNFKGFKRPVTLKGLSKWSKMFDCKSIANSVRTLDFSFCETHKEHDVTALYSLFVDLLAKLPNVCGLKVYGSILTRDDAHVANNPAEQFLHAIRQHDHALSTIQLEYCSLDSSILADLFNQNKATLLSISMSEVACRNNPWSEVFPILRDAPRLADVRFNKLHDGTNMRFAIFWTPTRAMRAVRNPDRKIKVVSRHDPSEHTFVSAVEFHTTDQHDARIEGRKAVTPGMDALVKYTQLHLSV